MQVGLQDRAPLPFAASEVAGSSPVRCRPVAQENVSPFLVIASSIGHLRVPVFFGSCDRRANSYARGPDHTDRRRKFRLRPPTIHALAMPEFHGHPRPEPFEGLSRSTRSCTMAWPSTSSETACSQFGGASNRGLRPCACGMMLPACAANDRQVGPRSISMDSCGHGNRTTWDRFGRFATFCDAHAPVDVDGNFK